MTRKNDLKTWISPCLAVAFLIISVTGVLMFFHFENAVINHLHQWLGWLFIGVGIIHLLTNWKLFLSLFKYKAAAISLCIVALITVGITLTSDNESGSHRHFQQKRYHHSRGR